MKRKSSRQLAIEPRLRVRRGADIALGPGKVELLSLIERTGSISQAAREMGMSYMRAWTLVRTINACFSTPLVVAERGGTKGGGGAKLTSTGVQVIGLYRDMEKQTVKAVQKSFRRLERFVKI
jgi:molybdate transport system regulatory protein